MKIGSDMSSGYMGMNSLRHGRGQQNTVKHRQNHDVLSISAEGEKKHAQKADDGVPIDNAHRAALKNESELARRSRIEKIKVDIQNGSYAVPNDVIVDAIIEKSGSR